MIDFSFVFTISMPGKKQVTPELLHFRHKLSPYLGNVLNGTVHKTILRGSIIFDDNQFPLNGAGIVLVEHWECWSINGGKSIFPAL